MELRTLTFVAPSGYEYTIREQNGEDEDILTNPREMRNLLHLSRYISAIVMDSKPFGKLTFEKALELPLLDRYCILFNSRIFSIGNILEFSYEWTNVTNGVKHEVRYEEDLNNYLFDYSSVPSDEEVNAKPHASPFFLDPSILESGQEFTLSSGKVVRWKVATSNSEQYLFKLTDEKRTGNAEIMARGLELLVENKWEKVTNFKLFSVKDMAEIRRQIKTYDPPFLGVSDIMNPDTGEVVQYPVMAAPGFFLLIEE